MGDFANSNLYIRGIPLDWREAELNALAGQYGKLVSSKVLLQNGESRGMGFAYFQTHAEAGLAAKNLNGHVLPCGGRGLVVKFAKDSLPATVGNYVPVALAVSGAEAVQKQGEFNGPKAVVYHDTNLYVSELPFFVTEEDLKALFQPLGHFVNCNILKNNGVSRGVGFVKYSNAATAAAAIAQFNGVLLSNAEKPISVKYATNKVASQQQQVQQQQMHQMYASYYDPYGQAAAAPAVAITPISAYSIPAPLPNMGITASDDYSSASYASYGTPAPAAIPAPLPQQHQPLAQPQQPQWAGYPPYDYSQYAQYYGAYYPPPMPGYPAYPQPPHPVAVPPATPAPAAASSTPAAGDEEEAATETATETVEKVGSKRKLEDKQDGGSDDEAVQQTKEAKTEE